MKVFFGVYIALVMGVFFLWALAPLRAQQEKLATEVEQLVFKEVNDLRQDRKLPALLLQEELSALARSHSKDMLSNKYFSHKDLSGCSSSCRMENAQLSFMSSGENIYTILDYSIDPAYAAHLLVREWMNNPERRANLFNKKFTHTGIGVTLGANALYATQDFAEQK